MLKLFCRPQDVWDARVVGYLMRKTVNMKWKYPRRKKFVAVKKRKKNLEIWRPLVHANAEFGVCLADFLSCFWNQSKDIGWILGDFELWTFNIVQIAIDYGEFRSWAECMFYYAMAMYGLQRLMFLNKSMKAREWNVKLGICLAPGSGTIRRYGLVGIGKSLRAWALIVSTWLPEN